MKAMLTACAAIACAATQVSIDGDARDAGRPVPLVCVEAIAPASGVTGAPAPVGWRPSQCTPPSGRSP